MTHTPNRREFLQQLATVTGGVVLVPAVFRLPAFAEGDDSELLALPATKPEGWDPIAFNRERGNAGAIPESYHASINGPDGEAKHLGKHLPYTPELDASLVPEGHLALMWGDPSKGHAKHPNAVRSEKNNNEGHWYNWIRIRKAAEGEAEELESRYSEWPGIGPDDNGAYAVMGGGEITDDGGKNTVYLAALPEGLKAGDTIRIHAHCLTHGEWVDFLTL
jgi:hypothetical protein